LRPRLSQPNDEEKLGLPSAHNIPPAPAKCGDDFRGGLNFDATPLSLKASTAIAGKNRVASQAIYSGMSPKHRHQNYLQKCESR
jgi:hypothetical protein